MIQSIYTKRTPTNFSDISILTYLYNLKTIQEGFYSGKKKSCNKNMTRLKALYIFKKTEWIQKKVLLETLETPVQSWKKTLILQRSYFPTKLLTYVHQHFAQNILVSSNSPLLSWFEASARLCMECNQEIRKLGIYNVLKHGIPLRLYWIKVRDLV